MGRAFDTLKADLVANPRAWLVTGAAGLPSAKSGKSAK